MKTVVVLALFVVAAVAVPPPNAQGKPMKVNQVPGRQHFNVHAHEKGVLVQEKVNVDQNRKLVSYYVPQHNQVDESEFIHDFKNKLTVMIFYKQKACYVTPLDMTDVQDPDTTVSAFKEAEKDGDMPVAGIQASDYSIEGTPQKPESLLPEDLIPKCRNFATFRAKKMMESFSVDEKDKNRKKRSSKPAAMKIIEGDSCEPCRKVQCVVSGRSCQYIVMCDMVDSIYGGKIPDCSKKQEVHKFSDILKCTTCCDMNHQLYYPPVPGFPGGHIKCSEALATLPKSSYPNC